jgi:metacaspase-1
MQTFRTILPRQSRNQKVVHHHERLPSHENPFCYKRKRGARRVVLYKMRARRRDVTHEDSNSNSDLIRVTAMSNHFAGGRALIVGIANYPRVTVLPEAVLMDARDVAALLKSGDHCAYLPDNVDVLIDYEATSQGIRDGLRRLASTTRPGDTAIFFFSGHGGRIQRGANERAFLIPYDCDPSQMLNTGIASEELTELISNIKAERLVVVLDACHSAGEGDLKALSPLGDIKAGLDEKTYDALAVGTGRVIMASSRSNEVSLILPGMQNSLFTHYLLKALGGAVIPLGDQMIRVFDVFQYVSEKVPARAKANHATQHPIFKAQDLETNFPLALRMGGKRPSASSHPRQGLSRLRSTGLDA